MIPHPGMAGASSLPPTSLGAGGLLAMTGGLGHPLSSMMGMQKQHDAHRDEKPSNSSSLSASESERHRSSLSPGEREKYRSRSPEPEMKRFKKEEKDKESDGEKSDQDLVVDDQNDDAITPPNGQQSPRENGLDKLGVKKEPHMLGMGGAMGGPLPGPLSPRSGTSSNASTPSAKKLEEKPGTPISKPL